MLVTLPSLPSDGGGKGFCLYGRATWRTCCVCPGDMFAQETCLPRRHVDPGDLFQRHLEHVPEACVASPAAIQVGPEGLDRIRGQGAVGFAAAGAAWLRRGLLPGHVRGPGGGRGGCDGGHHHRGHCGYGGRGVGQNRKCWWGHKRGLKAPDDVGHAHRREVKCHVCYAVCYAVSLLLS